MFSCVSLVPSVVHNPRDLLGVCKHHQISLQYIEIRDLFSINMHILLPEMKLLQMYNVLKRIECKI